MKTNLLFKAILLLFLALHYTPTVFAQGPVSSGLIAHYCFDGNADDAVGTKHSTVYGAALTTDRLGRANRAYYFDGVNDYIQMPSDIWFSGDFTISGWIKVDSYKGFARFYEFGTGAPGDNVVYSPTPTGWSATNDAFVIRRNTCTAYAEESAYAGPFPYNKWVHVVTVFKGTTGSVWRDGANVTITSAFSAPPCSVMRTACYFGKSPWSHDAYFHGKMDDVRIYNRALSAAEIDTLFKLDMTCIPCDAFKAGFKDSMISCYQYQFTDTSLLATKGIASWKWEFGDGGTSTVKNPLHSYSSNGSYTVRLIISDSLGCTDTAYSTINISTTGFADAGDDELLCLNDTGSAITTLNGSGGLSYNWSPTTGLDNPTAAITKATIKTTTIYILTVTDNKGCRDSDTLELIISPTANILARPDKISACKGSSVQLSATGGESYTWSPAKDLNNQLIENPILEVKETGKITVIGIDKNGCKGFDTIEVLAYNNPVVKAMTSDTTICFGSKLPLIATGAKSYLWTPSSLLDSAAKSNPILTAIEPTTIYVEGIDTNGCKGLDTLAIYLFPKIQVEASAADKHINCLNSRTYLSASNALSYYWEPTVFCETPQQANTFVSPTRNTLFTVTGLDNNGCQSSDTVTIYYDGTSSIKIANAFTPNGDQINDGIKIIDPCNFVLSSISIYNRWGDEVFRSQDINYHWDGTSKGKLCMPGVYYYMIKGKSNEGEELMYKGDITLIR